MILSSSGISTLNSTFQLCTEQVSVCEAVHCVNVAIPAEPRGEQKLIVCKLWAVKKFQRGAGEKFSSGVRA